MSGLLLGLALLTGIGADWVLLGQRAVEFWYDAKTFRGRRAVVRLFGLR